MDPTMLHHMFPPDGKHARADAFNPMQMSIFGRKPVPRPEPRPLKRKGIEEFPHYVAIVADAQGQVSIRSSASLKKAKKEVLAEAIDRVRAILCEPEESSRDTTESFKRSHEASPAPQAAVSEGSVSFPFSSKRRRVESSSTENAMQHNSAAASSGSGATSLGLPSKPVSARKEPPAPKALLQLRADDHDSWADWFSDAFCVIQQTVCRTIAKEWIKAIHPRKQSTHPYNGNLPRGEPASPERTKPNYWPPQVRHKEPDHIDKRDRVILLTHIITNTPQREQLPDRISDRLFKAKDLLGVLSKKRDEGMIKKWRYIRQLVTARDFLENYEDGGIDGDATIDVMDFSEMIRNNGKKKRAKGMDASASARDQEEDVECDDAGEGSDEESDSTISDPPSPPQTEIDEAQSTPMNMSFTSDVSNNAVEVKLEKTHRGRSRHERHEQQEHVPHAHSGFEAAGISHHRAMPIENNMESMGFLRPSSTPNDSFTMMNWSAPPHTIMQPFPRGMMPSPGHASMINKDRFDVGIPPQFQQAIIDDMMPTSAFYTGAFFHAPGFNPPSDMGFQLEHSQSHGGHSTQRQQQGADLSCTFDAPEAFYHMPRGM